MFSANDMVVCILYSSPKLRAVALKHQPHRGVRTRAIETPTGPAYHLRQSVRLAAAWQAGVRLVVAFFFFFFGQEVHNLPPVCSICKRPHKEFWAPLRPSNLLTKQDSNYGGR